MAMIIDWEKNILKFDVPNSEANLNAQHNGIMDRSVGSYYMSENADLCRKFFNNFDGDFYIDVNLCIMNFQKIFDKLINLNYQSAFKESLKPQASELEALKWMVNNYHDYFHKVDAPSINENNKYLKFNNSDTFLTSIKSMLLGDITSLLFKRIGTNGYVIWIDKNDKFDEMLSSGVLTKWIK